MGVITCQNANCKFNENTERGHLGLAFGQPPIITGICRKGHGYDYGGGDITVSPHGHCMSYERKLVKPAPKPNKK